MPFFWKSCNHRPILGIHSLTRGLHDLLKWVFRDGAGRQTDRQTCKQTDMATLGRFSEKTLESWTVISIFSLPLQPWSIYRRSIVIILYLDIRGWTSKIWLRYWFWDMITDLNFFLQSFCYLGKWTIFYHILISIYYLIAFKSQSSIYQKISGYFL